jgi:anaerobic ribonucleoside-triphosphate reductase
MPKGRNEVGTPIKCTCCGYEWKTLSEHFYVPCPRCHRQQKNREVPKLNHVNKRNSSKKEEVVA